MLLHFPDDNRYWLPAGSSHWEFLFLCLHGPAVLPLWSQIENARGPLITLTAGSVVVTRAADLVRDMLAERVTSSFAASALAYEWLMLLLDEGLNPERDSGHPHRAALEAAQRHGREHLAAPIGVEDLARVAGLSRYHFTRLFKAHTGLAPMAWLLDQRIREATRLLRTTALSLKEISARCGFSDPGYFGRLFSHRTGQTPGEYRRGGLF